MFCQKCGNKLEDNTVFCGKCGNKLETYDNNQKVQTPIPEVSQNQSYQNYNAYNQVNQNPYIPNPYMKPKKKNKIVPIIIIIFFVLIAGFVALMFLGNSEISDVKMASAIDNITQKPTVRQNVFTENTPIIYCAMKTNVKAGTVVKIEWYYLDLEEDYLIAPYQVSVTEKGQQISFSLSAPDNGWPLGNYTAKIYVDAKFSQSVNFEIK